MEMTSATDRGTIIYIGGFELPDKNAAAHRVLSNAKILRELGYEVIFIGVSKHLNYGEVQEETIQGFLTISIPYPKSITQWLIQYTNIDLFKKVLEKHSNVKAVVCYNFKFAAFFKLLTYCKARKIKVISDCTEWYSAEDKKHIFKLVKMLDSAVRMKVIHPRVDGNIVISKFLYDYYKPLNSQIISLPPLVDFNESKWKNLSYKAVDDKSLKLIYAGSPGLTKDRLLTIIEILALIKSQFNYAFSLKVIGLTYDEFVKMNKDKALPQMDFVEFKGRRPHLETLSEVANADFQIILRDDTRLTKAGFPSKLVESLSAGTPVIANPTSNITDYIVDGENGFLLDTSSDERLFETMKTALSQSRASINKMKQNCRNDKTFDYKKYIIATGEFLSSVFNQ